MMKTVNNIMLAITVMRNFASTFAAKKFINKAEAYGVYFYGLDIVVFAYTVYLFAF